MKKRYNQVKIIITLILLTNLITAPIYAETPKQIKSKTSPEINPEKLRVNLTETIPKEFSYQTKVETPQQLQFKNMILELTTTRNMNMTINSDDQVRIQYLSINMTMTQNMHLNMNLAQQPPENIPEPEISVHKYLTLEPNVTEPIRSTLRLYLNQEEIPEDSSIEEFTWCYWNGTHWDPTPTRYTFDGFLETNTTHFSTWTVKEQQKDNLREMETTEISGLREETKAYNYTDVTPSGFQYKVKKNTPTMLQFKNSAIYMHGTNPVELEYSAEEQNRNRLIRVDVESVNPLHLRFNLRESKPDDIVSPEKGMGFYCEIEPNQTITQARLGYEINPVEVQSLNMMLDRLSWAYWNGTNWEIVYSTINEDNVLEAETDHFSTWTIVEFEETTIEAPVEESVDIPENVDSDSMIPIPVYAVGIGLILAVLLLMRQFK